MTQIDEINTNRHLEMYFLEFIEALGRIADKYSPAPLISQVYYTYIYILIVF